MNIFGFAQETNTTQKDNRLVQQEPSMLTVPALFEHVSLVQSREADFACSTLLLPINIKRYCIGQNMNLDLQYQPEAGTLA